MSEFSSEKYSDSSEKKEQENEDENDESENNEEESENNNEDEENDSDSNSNSNSNSNESKNDEEESVNNYEDNESDDDNDKSKKEEEEEKDEDEEDENNIKEKNNKNSNEENEKGENEKKSKEEENSNEEGNNEKGKKQLKEKSKKDKKKNKIKDEKKMKNEHKSNNERKKDTIKENEEKKGKYPKNKINDKKRNEIESEENKEKKSKFKYHLKKSINYNNKLYEKKINNSSSHNKQRQETLMNISNNNDNNEESCLSSNKNDFYLYDKDKNNHNLNKNIKEDNLSNLIMNNEVNLLNEKIKYLEAKNMRLDSLNQMYYDIIKSTNLQTINNEHNNNYNNYLKLQKLDYNPNYILNNMNPNDLDFMINNYIDGERNRNINDFNNSMIDINKKITNYLIDNCVKEKENNNFMKKLEEVKNEINEKLVEINKTQKKQKNDIDFIIKYGLNKNKALDSIMGIILEQPKPLPKLLRDDEKDRYKYDKVTNKNNITPYKNFSVYGRYTNKQENRNRDNRGVLKRTGSCVFGKSNKNEYNYKIDEDSDPHKYNHNIYPNYSKRPIFEKIEKNDNLDEYKYNFKNKNRSLIVGDEDEFFEKEKFEAYNNRYFVPKDFKFGTKMKKSYIYNNNNKNKNLNFLIDDI